MRGSWRNHARRRAGLATSDVVIGVAALALVLAAAAPTLRARGFASLVEQARGDVETLRSAAEQYFASSQAWPTPGEAGTIPPEVATAFPGAIELVQEEYSIQWQVLEMIERRNAPPGSNPIPADADATPDSVGPEQMSVPVGIGGIVLRSSNDALLGALLGHYGPRTSFVRDSTWTLIIGAPGGL